MKRAFIFVLCAFFSTFFLPKAKAEEWPDGSFSFGGYALIQIPVGSWATTSSATIGGGIRAEFALYPATAGFALCAEGVAVMPASDSDISSGLDLSFLGGVWARLFNTGRLWGIPSLWAGALIHSASGEKSGVFLDLEFRAEFAFRIRTSGGLSFDLAPFYVRAAEENSKVLHGPGLRAGIMYNFGRWKYETMYPEDSKTE